MCQSSRLRGTVAWWCELFRIRRLDAGDAAPLAHLRELFKNALKFERHSAAGAEAPFWLRLYGTAEAVP